MYREPGSVTIDVLGLPRVVATGGLLQDVVDRLPGRAGLRPRRVVVIGPRLGAVRLDDQGRLAGVQSLAAPLRRAPRESRPAGTFNCGFARFFLLARALHCAASRSGLDPRRAGALDQVDRDRCRRRDSGTRSPATIASRVGNP